MSDLQDSAGSAPADFKNARRRKAELAGSAAVDRLPPHDTPAEQGVLGCILLDPESVLPLVITKLKGGPEEFYDLRHRTIYETIVQMREDAIAVDLITLQKELKDWLKLEAVGGLAYLASLPDVVPSAANVEHYIDIVREKFVLRQMIGTCTEVVSRAYEHQGEVDGLIADFIHNANAIAGHLTSTESTFTAKQLLPATISKIEYLHANQGQVSGIATGFIDFDKMTGGLQNSDMIVIAARPSIGKTSLALNIAEHAAITLGIPVGIFSLEMSKESLMLRAISSLARVSLKDIRDGYLNERDFNRLAAASGKLNTSKLVIDDTPALEIHTLRARAKLMQQQHGIRLFIIDYLQLMRGKRGRSDNRQQEVSDVSSGVKALAKEAGAPVIALSQLNRESEKEKNRRPKLSDLRESGSIEQDADVVTMLYRPSRPDDDDCTVDHSVSTVNLIIAKQRNGPTGEIPLTFMKQYTRFESAAKISGADVPEQPQIC